MKVTVRLALSVILALQMGCASSNNVPVVAKFTDNFSGFPPLAKDAAPDRDVASSGEMKVRKNFGGYWSYVSQLAQRTGAKPGELYLEKFLGTYARPNPDRMKAEDLSLVLAISNERSVLMNNNLFDTGIDTDKNQELIGKENGQASWCERMMSTKIREPDGNCYYVGLEKAYPEKEEFKNLKYHEKPQAGNNQARFGRNTKQPDADVVAKYKADIVKPDDPSTDMMSPNPRLISKELFARKNGIQEADIINVLAAAWLQAMNHDWFTHGKNVSHGRQSREIAANPQLAKLFAPFQIPDPENPNGPKMMIPRTRPDMSHITDVNGDASANNFPVTFRNNVTHWWDASEIYGSDRKTILEVRTSPQDGSLIEDGKIAVDEENKRLYYKADGTPITGFGDNWWTGLEMIHTIFALEHNKVVEMLKLKYPEQRLNKMYAQPLTKELRGEWYFQKARLIVAAEMARIHTIEWTPALLDNDALHVGMYANWHGLLPFLNASPLVSLGNRVLSDHYKQAFRGLTGANADLYLYKAPFTLTEEFVSVYRMHPLIPDSLKMYDLSGNSLGVVPVKSMIFKEAPGITSGAKGTTSNVMLSFGVNHPGAMTLNNYPDFIRNVTVKHNTDDPTQDVVMDIGAVDIMRDRERLVPRYNEFRRRLGDAIRNPVKPEDKKHMEMVEKSYPNGPKALEPIKTFEDLTDNPVHLAALKKIYGNDVEKLDLLVGTLAEKDRYAGYAFGNTPFYIFAIMASRRLMADPFFNKYLTAEVYTQEGLDWIAGNSIQGVNFKGSTMKDVIVRNFPELEPHFKGVTNAFQPWNLTAK